MMGTRRVYMVDDEQAIRRSLQLMLRVLGYQVKLFESGTSFLAALPELASGCVLLDLRMPQIDGLEVQRRLTAEFTNYPVVMMSGHGDLGVAVAALEQGAIAFLEKPFSRAALERALSQGFLRLTDFEAYRNDLRSAALAVQRLPSTERQVLGLMARGHDSHGVAQLTGLSDLEVEVARARIFAELQAQTVTEVLHLAFAARRGAML